MTTAVIIIAPSQLVTSVLIIIVATMAHAGGWRNKEEQAVEKVTEGTNKFAISLFRALSSSRDGNVFVSPVSVQLVLALAYTGAKGETANELATLLSLPENLDDTFKGYEALIKTLQDPVLNVATRMFVEASVGVKKDFQTNAKKHFQSPAEAVDFKSASEKSRELINAWVEKQTNKKITNLLAPGMVEKDTRLILVNAIHFKANWKHKFLEEDTMDKMFHVTKAKTVPVQMMNTKKKFGFRYDEELQAKILELMYEGNQFRMLVILPDEIEGLPRLEKQLETVNLSEKIRYMQETTVTVSLPKFKLEETMDLKGILMELGAKSMFDGRKADFRGLSDEPLAVSQVVQKAFVEVNEKGTEAAAATAAIIRLRRSLDVEEDPAEFIADHQFAFVIIHNASGSVVFVGKFSSPDESKEKREALHEEL